MAIITKLFFQTKFLLVLYIFLIMLLGILIPYIVNRGVQIRLALVSTVLPVYKRKRGFKPVNLLPIFLNFNKVSHGSSIVNVPATSIDSNVVRWRYLQNISQYHAFPFFNSLENWAIDLWKLTSWIETYNYSPRYLYLSCCFPVC